MLAGDGVIDRDAERAARRGKRYMIDPSLPLDEVKRLVALYDAAYQGESGMELPMFNYGFISDDSDPWEEMRPGFTYLRQTYDRWGGREVRGRCLIAPGDAAIRRGECRPAPTRRCSSGSAATSGGRRRRSFGAPGGCVLRGSSG